MIQASEPWHRYDLGIRSGVARCFTAGWRSLCQREMRPVFVVVAGVLKKQIKQKLQRTEHEPVVAERCCREGKSAVGFTTMLDREDEDGVAVVVEADAVVAYAQTQFWRLDLLEAFNVSFAAGEIAGDGMQDAQRRALIDGA